MEFDLPSIAVLLRLLTIGLSNGAVIALNAIGVTLAYGVVRTINFAYGDLFALGTVLVAWTISLLGLQPDMSPLLLLGGLGLVFSGALIYGGLLNAAVEQVAFRPFRSRSRLAPLIAGIGLSFMLYQGALLLRYLTNFFTPGEHRSVPGVPELPRIRIPELVPSLNLAEAIGLPSAIRYTLKDLLVLLVSIGLATLVGWFLRSTRTGRALRACSQDAEVVQLCGVDRDRTIRQAFVLSGLLSGAAAFMFALYYTHPYTQYGAQSGLVAFTAAVLGGIGRPSGAFISGLILGVVSALSDYFLAAHWTPVLILAILILLLLLRPSGLSSGDESDDQEAASAATFIERAIGQHGGVARWVAGGLILLGLLYPLLDSAFNLQLQVVVTKILIFALLALGLNLVLGMGGLLDLGYAACFAIGAYTTGLLTMPGSQLYWLTGGTVDILPLLVICALAAGLFGVLSGVLTVRLRGEYLAIVTLALGQLAPRIILNLHDWTGGARGMSAIPPPRLLSYSLTTPLARYYLVLALVLLVALASRRLASSRLGRAWMAMSIDELAAANCGIHLTAQRCLVFVLGAAIAGMAGTLFASSFSYVDPNQSEFQVSALVLAMVVIGGAGNINGAILGALLVVGYDLVIIPHLGDWLDQVRASGGPLAFLAIDIRALNFFSFGVLLYVAVLLRARRSTERSVPSSSLPAQPQQATSEH